MPWPGSLLITVFWKRAAISNRFAESSLLLIAQALFSHLLLHLKINMSAIGHQMLIAERSHAPQNGLVTLPIMPTVACVPLI